MSLIADPKFTPPNPMERGVEGWEKTDGNILRFRDSCSVYAVRGPEGTVLVNAGTGRAADHLSEIAGKGPLFVLLTHHFRDHADGAIRLHEAGAKILAPYWEEAYLVDPEEQFRARQVWNSYDNRWDRFCPVRPLPISDWMMDYERRVLAGLEWEVLPTPAHSQGAVSYILRLEGKKYAFTGELIAEEGKTARLAPLQYNYNDMDGARNLWHSCERLKACRTDRLFPSLGEPIEDPERALTALQENLLEIDRVSPGFRKNILDSPVDDIEEVLPDRLYRSKRGNAQTHFILSGKGKVLSLDYGYDGTGYKAPSKHHLSNRRPLLHGLEGLKKRFGIDRIDTVLLTHFHDDHVNGVPLLRRLFQTRVWAAQTFAAILEEPARHDLPCLWHEPFPVDLKLPCAKRIAWEDIAFTLYPMSGHTRFATLVCLEIDGHRVAHTGDQIFFQNEKGLGYGPKAKLFPNHVYKNGADLGCYLETWKRLRDFQPDWVLTGHTPPYRVEEGWLEEIEKGARAFDAVHRALMPVEEEETHFGIESQPAKLEPYHALYEKGGKVTLSGWVLNPFPVRKTASLKLVVPEGWKSEAVALELAPRERKTFALPLSIPSGYCCRRQPVALDLKVGDQPFGQVTEALFTVGRERF